LETLSIRTLLVEDFKPYRSLITSLLRGIPKLQVIGEAADGLEAVAKAQQLGPELILMDIGLPKLNGIEAARRIRAIMPLSKIVFLTQETVGEVVREALRLGACGYIVKQQAETDLLSGLQAVLQGKRFVSRGLADDMFASTNGPGASG